MKLYIKQKPFSWRDKFSVKDENGTDRYFVEGELFSLGKRLHVTDPAGREVMTIVQKLWTFRHTYEVYREGKLLAVVRKEFSLLTPRYTVEGVDWQAEGSFMGLEYAVNAGSRQVAVIHKAFMSWGDSYELDIACKEDELPALAVVLAIDCAVAQQNSAASNP